jgi:8-oxo-dGTP diphosphatase
MSQAGKWEFPGGKVEAGETPQQALVREIEEELGAVISVERHLARGRSGPIVLDVYTAQLVAGEPEAREHAEIAWLDADGVRGLDWAEADVPAAHEVAELLAGKAQARDG